MSDLSAMFPQLEVLRGCSPSEARDLGVSKAKLWDCAWECLRLHGRMDDEQLIDLLSFVQEKLEDMDVETHDARQCLDDAIHEIAHLPCDPEPERVDDLWA